MASLPKPSTIFSWIIYLVPLYLFVFAPLLRQFFPSSEDGDLDADKADEAAHQHIPALNLSDDSFISPEDATPLNCGKGEDNYQIHLLSRDPLAIYIEGFLSDREADHLVDVRCVSVNFEAFNSLFQLMVSRSPSNAHSREFS